MTPQCPWRCLPAWNLLRLLWVLLTKRSGRTMRAWAGRLFDGRGAGYHCLWRRHPLPFLCAQSVRNGRVEPTTTCVCSLFLCGVIKRCYCESFPESCEASSLEPKDGWRCIVGGHRLLHGVRHVNILNPEEKHDTHCDRRQAL